jgi:phosphopantetheinyl transferase
MRERAVTDDSIPQPFCTLRHFGYLPRCGEVGIVRRPWRRVAHVPGRVPAWCCQCVEEDADEAWDEASAPYILLEPEWRIWHRLPQAAARRQWLRGRVAAKDAIRLLVMERYGLTASLEVISILPDAHGQPTVSCPGLPDEGAGLCLSLSHCGNTSVALATERSEFCRGVGIDVESPMDCHEGLAEGGFTSVETSLLDDFPAPERDAWLLRLWCAKEAAGKALGVGLQGDPLNYRVSRINRLRQTVEVEASVVPPPAEPSTPPVRMTAHVGCDRGLAFAVATLEGT